MHMIRKALVTVALLSLFQTAGATRVIEQVERAVEMTLAELTLPSADGSTVSFRECPGCSLSTHRLTDTTELRANGQTVALADFLRVAGEIDDKPNGSASAIAVVFLHIKTGRLTRIEIRE
jgi:hypothetical protein